MVVAAFELLNLPVWRRSAGHGLAAHANSEEEGTPQGGGKKKIKEPMLEKKVKASWRGPTDRDRDVTAPI